MKKVVILIILATVSYTVQAQGIVGFSLQGFAPTGELKEDSPGIWGGGFNLESGYKLPNAPVIVGLSLDYIRYGSKLRKGFHGSDLGDVRFRRNFETLRFLPFVRIQPSQSSKILPYGDFFTGLSYIMTRATIRERALDLIDSYTEIDDIVFSYGFGGGIEIMLDDYVSLDINAKYIRSGRAQYLTPATVSYNPQFELYDLEIQNSRFNTLTFGIGVKVVID